ncbi:hypothetical protein LshimejAT787_0505780 [Lyophyllum shimeji]|uniref:Uncharacterized protein n=1 Tax=Lyophyllum shimeji TaxID=47721 RepID=A0A9P3PMN6_LYOSH|nr:hypothetical protein LshimejAT787_0505780 [Lyophyllum shimeji]
MLEYGEMTHGRCSLRAPHTFEALSDTLRRMMDSMGYTDPVIIPSQRSLTLSLENQQWCAPERYNDIHYFDQLRKVGFQSDIPGGAGRGPT